MIGAPKTFPEWASEYEAFDVPSLLAEAATLNDTEPFNRLAAMFVRLIDMVTTVDFSAEDRLRIVRLALAIQGDLERMTENDPPAQGPFDAARRAQFAHIEQFAPYPEFARLIFPKRLASS